MLRTFRLADPIVKAASSTIATFEWMWISSYSLGFGFGWAHAAYLEEGWRFAARPGRETPDA